VFSLLKTESSCRKVERKSSKILSTCWIIGVQLSKKKKLRRQSILEKNKVQRWTCL